jgi:hypothetical protein
VFSKITQDKNFQDFLQSSAFSMESYRYNCSLVPFPTVVQFQIFTLRCIFKSKSSLFVTQKSFLFIWLKILTLDENWNGAVQPQETYKIFLDLIPIVAVVQKLVIEVVVSPDELPIFKKGNLKCF